MPRQPWREIDDEVRFHLDMLVRDYLARGYAREDAERAARERFGDADRVRRVLMVLRRALVVCAAGAAVGLVGAFVAAYLPAYQASRVDPARALKAEP